ncbi:MAG: adenylate/guanylate cyclase domain-containing protein [Blastocatellia bacterium]|nr:adenylate/guanylate cyclase domain-containing protein [Blastocatellia bacterium]
MRRSEEVITKLIEQRLETGADIAAIDRKIWSMFGETWAIFCSDMSGFTKRTDNFGIIHFLSLIHEMRKLVRPIALNYNGLIIKEEADNLLILFRHPEDALQCAITCHNTTTQYNTLRPEDYTVKLSIGIGYGKILKLGDHDCFGAEVNHAFKLGEDTAKADETLLTKSAYESVKHLEGIAFREVKKDEEDIFGHYYKLED